MMESRKFRNKSEAEVLSYSFFFFLFSIEHGWLKQHNFYTRQYWGSGDSLLVERGTHDPKVASSNPSGIGRRFFFSRVNFVC